MVATLGSRYKALIMVANIETARPEIWEKQQAATIQLFILQITDRPNHREWQSPVKWAMSRANNGCFTSILCWIHDLVPLPFTDTKNSPIEDMKQFLSGSTRVCYTTQPFFVSSRSRRLEVVGARKTGRARGRHACLPFARPFFLAPTIFKRQLRRLQKTLLPCFGEERCVILTLWRGTFRDETENCCIAEDL